MPWLLVPLGLRNDLFLWLIEQHFFVVEALVLIENVVEVAKLAVVGYVPRILPLVQRFAMLFHEQPELLFDLGRICLVTLAAWSSLAALPFLFKSLCVPQRIHGVVG